MPPPAQGGKSLDAAKIDAAYVGFQAKFMDALAHAPSLYNRIADVAETDSEVNRQLWISNIPAMRQWIGPKHLYKLRGESHPIVTNPYEASIQIPKRDIINDRLGLWSKRIGDMALAYTRALDKLVVDMLVAGVVGTSLGTTYDGQNLLDTDHTALSVGGTAQTNIVTGALSATTFATAFERFLGMVDEFGNPLEVTPRILLTGKSNRTVARKLVGQKTMANGEENIDEGIVDLIIHPRITGTQWFLLPEGSTAVILHKKGPVEFLSVEEGMHTFMTGTYLYGIEAEFGAAYGLWQHVVGGPGT